MYTGSMCLHKHLHLCVCVYACTYICVCMHMCLHTQSLKKGHVFLLLSTWHIIGLQSSLDLGDHPVYPVEHLACVRCSENASDYMIWCVLCLGSPRWESLLCYTLAV